MGYSQEISKERQKCLRGDLGVRWTKKRKNKDRRRERRPKKWFVRFLRKTINKKIREAKENSVTSFQIGRNK